MSSSKVPVDRATASGGIDRVKPLDGLRGLASLGVALFWHYQHFGGNPQHYPYHIRMRWFYGYGWMLVDLFFLLSGMVMTLRYLEPLARGEVDARSFAVLRLARIYPMHLVGLLLAAGCQWYFLSISGLGLIYPPGDLFRFVQNLLLIQYGWIDQVFSYNAPSWSVSVEFLAYSVFALVAIRARRMYVPIAALIVILALGIQRHPMDLPLLNLSTARVLAGFFLGSLLQLALSRLNRAQALRVGVACGAAILSLILLTRWLGYDRFVGGLEGHVLGIFPLVVATVLTVRPVSWLLSLRPFVYLGDISYSLYMVHVPAQMLLLLILVRLRIVPPVETRWFFFAYAASLVVLAAVVHHLVEAPARRWLRGRLASRDGAKGQGREPVVLTPSPSSSTGCDAA